MSDSDPALHLSLIATENGPAFRVTASDDDVPPIIALAFGRALVAASEVFLMADSQTPEEQPGGDLPVYPRTSKAL
jgi:hypothetical protein